VAGEAGGIEDEKNGVGFFEVGHAAFEDVVGDLFVFAAGFEGVDAGEVDEGEGVAGVKTQGSDVSFDGDSGVVRDFLTEAGEAIEESAFPGIGRADERN
jgi:hypothetical protein